MGGLVVALVAVLLTAGCGSALPAQPSPTAAADATPTPEDAFPPHDLPLAQASASLQRLWRYYAVTVIPGRDVLNSIRPVTRFTDDALGTVSETTAGQWAVDLNREARWLQWALENDQRDFIGYLRQEPYDGRLDELLRSGAHVHVPDCLTYSDASRLVQVNPIDPLVRYGHIDTVWVVHYPGPCAITATLPGGNVETLFTAPSSGTIRLVPGFSRSEQVLGSLWISRAVDCTSLDSELVQPFRDPMSGARLAPSAPTLCAQGPG